VYGRYLQNSQIFTLWAFLGIPSGSFRSSETSVSLRTSFGIRELGVSRSSDEIKSGSLAKIFLGKF
jgi:hypothetical protein